jgi:plasmid maintenance system antidote protein VapI
MPSFQITLSPKRRAATRFIGQVRRQLQRALAEEKADNGVTQSGIARRLDVHRSVISRELRGQKDIGLGRVAEFAWALGLEPHFELKRTASKVGQNVELPKSAASPGPLDINRKLERAVAA